MSSPTNPLNLRTPPTSASTTSFQGIWTALITPFTATGAVDVAAFQRLVQRQIEAAITGVFIHATTGESTTLSEPERRQLVLAALEVARSTPLKVFASIGTACTATSLADALWAEAAGVDGLLAITPYYSKPSQQGLVAHFQAIADRLERVPLVLYNNPGRTAVHLEPATVALLAKHPRIQALKESSGSLNTFSDLQVALGRNAAGAEAVEFTLLAGDDSLFLPSFALGAQGLVSVAANLIPSTMMKVYQALASQNWAAAQQLHHQIYPLLRDLFVASNPVPVKFALSAWGWCEPHVRLPLVPLGREHRVQLQATLDRFEEAFEGALDLSGHHGPTAKRHPPPAQVQTAASDASPNPELNPSCNLSP